VLILSEFAGAAQELPNSFIVNPYNVNVVAQAIKKALGMTAEEKQKMVKPMRDRVIEYDARYWADSFFQDLVAEAVREPLPVTTMDVSLEAIGPLLQAKSAAFFLDYDGTISELKRNPEDAIPDNEIKVGDDADTMAKFRISGPKAFRAFLTDILDYVQN